MSERSIFSRLIIWSLFTGVFLGVCFQRTWGEDPTVLQDQAPAFACVLWKQLKAPENDPLHLPTQALSLRDGRTVLLDGANHRIVFFDHTGAHEGSAGMEGNGPGEFSEPLGFCSGPGHTLIMADTGNHRLQVLDGNGFFIRQVTLEDLPHEMQPTGVACDLKNGRIYVTDRANQSLHLLGLPGFDYLGTQILEPSEEGLASYPLSPCIDQESLLVVEPLAGRIRQRDLVQGSDEFLGTRGLGFARLYRPKGVAVDEQGRRFVSDSWQGKIAVFSRLGLFIDWLRDAKGAPAFFQSPWGLCFDEAGR
ncbi:MAG: NHL repeat-containing protein, partial [Planctomycetes bacterium]|nr:NHL repeat-containing protein [Planctomycetota bacterium]